MKGNTIGEACLLSSKDCAEQVHQRGGKTRTPTWRRYGALGWSKESEVPSGHKVRKRHCQGAAYGSEDN